MSELGGRLTLLSGGPLDGQVCLTAGLAPCVLIGSPRELELLDDPVVDAEWDDEVRWYVVRLRVYSRVEALADGY